MASPVARTTGGDTVLTTAAVVGAAGKSVGAGVARAIGWKANEVWKSRKQKATLDSLDLAGARSFEIPDFVSDLEPARASL